MKILYKWLNDFVNISDIDPYELAETLTIKTAEIENVENIRDKYSSIVSAYIKQCEKINNKYYKCKVIADKEYTVIAGAPNTRAGIMTFFVKPGGKINGIKIDKKKIANSVSEGMLLSGKELGINNDHSGIIELENIKENTDINDIIDFYDYIIEIDNKSLTHRPDLWGIYGFAREIAAIYNKKLKSLELFDTNTIKTEKTFPIEIKDKNLCYRYVGIKINNINVIPSPLNMQLRLTRTEHSPKNLIVDLTNYIMTEIGQPMHAFDGNSVKKIIVSPLIENMDFKTLDNEIRHLEKGTLMINSQNEPVAIAGIMGGGNSEINDNSNSLFLESASFNAAKIRNTSVKLNLRTDSSTRFEKSLDPEFAIIAAKRYIKLLIDNQKDIEFETALSDINYNPFKRNIIKTKYTYIKKQIGVDIDNKKIDSILKSLEFDIESNNDNITIIAPTFRSTKDISIPADIIEEVARVYGYNNITPSLPYLKINVPDFNREREIEHLIKDILTYDYQMNEVDSYIWYNNKFLKLINYKPKNAIELKNILSSENTMLRKELTTTLLNFAYENLKYFDSFSLYDIGTVFENNNEQNHLGIIIVNEKQKNGELNVFKQLKEIVSNLIFRILKTKCHYEKGMNAELLNPANITNIMINNKIIGIMGSIHPKIYSIFDKKVNIACAEIDISQLLIEPKQLVFEEFSNYPISYIDFSILKPPTETYKTFLNNVLSFNNNLIISNEIIAIYEGKELNGFKSITIRFAITDKSRTLNSTDIDNFRNEFLNHIKQFNYSLR